VLYEVYKYVKRERSEEEALLHSALMMRTRFEPFSEASALWAADVSLEQGLSMADAMVFAAAQKNRALLVTLDSDFKGLPGVEYLGK
jgi:predicted nucleic acid-binding protein